MLDRIRTNFFALAILYFITAGLLLHSAAYADLAGRISSIIDNPSQKSAVFAIKIVEAKSGQCVYALEPAKPMIPASNMKVLTSAAALKYLGADYQFVTRVGLLGDALVIIGGGDPLLGDLQTDQRYNRPAGWIFTDITEALKSKGIGRIHDIIIDKSFFDDVYVHPSWPAAQLNNQYACEISGLNYNLNCIQLTVCRQGQTISITKDPDTKYIELDNKVVPVEKGTSAVGAYRNSQPNRLLVKGRCNVSAQFDVAIENPPAFFGFILYERLMQAGITVEGKMIEKYTKQDRNILILREYKTPITDVLARCNKQSLGLAAECLLKTISAENTQGKISGEWPHGVKLVERYLGTLGIDAAQFKIDDGSGLSREDCLSTNAICAVLLDMYRSNNWQIFRDSLAVGGVDGTAERYFTDDKYAGKIRGKTGYITGVRAFSGVCESQGRDYIFSILTQGGNNNTRNAINEIVTAVIDEKP